MIDDYGIVLESTDGGSNWSWINDLNPLCIGRTRSIGKASFTDSTHIWATVSGAAQVAKSDDAGRTWRFVAGSGSTVYVRALTFYDASIGWEVGTRRSNDYEKILKTTDGGQTWMHQLSTATTDASIEALDIVDSNTALAVGGAGAIWKTTDGGTTWLDRNYGVPVSLSMIDMFNRNVGLIAGNNGAILRTTDGGETWAAQYSGTSRRLSYAKTFGDSLAYCGGDEVLLKSTDGGVSWSKIEPLPFRAYGNWDFLNPAGSFVKTMKCLLMK